MCVGGNLFNLLAFRSQKKSDRRAHRKANFVALFQFSFFFFLKVGRLLANGHGMNEYDRITGGTTTGAD